MQKITNNSGHDIVFPENDKGQLKYKDIVDNKINEKLKIDGVFLFNAFFKGRIVTSLLTSFLPSCDILSLREAVVGTPREGVDSSLKNVFPIQMTAEKIEKNIPFYQQIEVRSKKDNIRNKGFVYERKCDMLSEIDRIFGKTERTHQKKISKLINEGVRLDGKAFREKIQLKIFEYLLSLDEMQMLVISLSDLSSNYFLFKKDVSDVLKIRKFCRDENSHFDMKDVNPSLLLAASHDLYIREKFDLQFEVIQILNKELTDKKDALLDALNLSQISTAENNITLQKIAQNDVKATRNLMESSNFSDSERMRICEILRKTRRFDLANEIVLTITDPDSRKYMTCLDLIEQDNKFEKALEIALTIAGDNVEIYKNKICSSFIKVGALKKALNLALTIGGEYRDLNKCPVCYTFIRAGFSQEALELALTMNGNDEALNKNSVCCEFIRAGFSQEALELALTMNGNDEARHKYSVCRAFMHTGFSQEASELALTIEGEYRALDKCRVCYTFIHAGFLQKALDLALTIDEEYEAENKYSICKALIDVEALEESLKLALTIEKESCRADLCKTLIAVGSLEKALALAVTIKGMFSEALRGEIRKAFIVAGAVKEALEFVLAIYERSSPLIIDCCKDFINAGALKEALKLALTIERDYTGFFRGEVRKAFMAAEALKEAQNLG